MREVDAEVERLRAKVARVEALADNARRLPKYAGLVSAGELLDALSGPDPTQECNRCRGLGYVPDFKNWDDYHGEPKPKPCPDCGPKPTEGGAS